MPDVMVSCTPGDTTFGSSENKYGTQIAELHLHGPGDTLEVVLTGGDMILHLECPWAGDSESGFGESLSGSLPIAEARKLAQWILDQTTKFEV